MPLDYPHPRLVPGRRGFTLIELLTVIAIICVLAGILQPLIGTVMRQARKARSLVLFTNLDTAFNGYRQEYGRYPIFKELNAVATPWSTNKNEIDYSFILNDGDAILRRVLTADNDYLTAASTPGATNYNRNATKFLELDETFLARGDINNNGSGASSVNPYIMDGFKNTDIGVIIHTGDNQEIDEAAFATATPVQDSEGTSGGLLPKVVHNLPQDIAIYSLVLNLNDDAVNSSWVTNWPYTQYNK
jgi:prepilin-type N-terminal cleavage/methylation domain-containing protein